MGLRSRRPAGAAASGYGACLAPLAASRWASSERSRRGHVCTDCGAVAGTIIRPAAPAPAPAPAPRNAALQCRELPLDVTNSPRNNLHGGCAAPAAVLWAQDLGMRRPEFETGTRPPTRLIFRLLRFQGSPAAAAARWTAIAGRGANWYIKS
eukprot:SAG31_NODE_4065_length_3623_cov_4.472758_3_plen_152_part_00